jgi:signal peptidase I
MLQRIRKLLVGGARPAPRISSAIAGQLMLDLPATFSFRALGSSMLPTIRSGSVLTIVRTPNGSAQPGDIVLVVGPNGPIVHRAVATPDGLVLWGDALPCPDGKLVQFAWVGKVVTIEPPHGGARLRALFDRVANRVRRLSGERPQPR